MGKIVLTNAWVRINNVDLTDHVQEVAVNREADQVDVTAMAAFAYEYAQGLKKEGFDVSFFQDFASGKVDATLEPLYASGSAFLVEVAANGSSISGTNPKWSGTCILAGYSPISGAVGDAAVSKVAFPCNGGTIARGTT